MAWLKKEATCHDLDHLAGSWSSAEAKTFEKNIEYFEQIDEDLWQ